MGRKLVQTFVASAGVVLLVTGGAKIVSALGQAGILDWYDPVLGISFRLVFWLVGGTEIGVGAVCPLSRRAELGAGLVLWLAIGFVVYRLGLWVVGYQEPCSCLGSLSPALGISAEAADRAMRIVLGYLLAGSLAAVGWMWRSRRRSKVEAGRRAAVQA